MSQQVVDCLSCCYILYSECPTYCCAPVCIPCWLAGWPRDPLHCYTFRRFCADLIGLMLEFWYHSGYVTCLCAPRVHCMFRASEGVKCGRTGGNASKCSSYYFLSITCFACLASPDDALCAAPPLSLSYIVPPFFAARRPYATTWWHAHYALVRCGALSGDSFHWL